MVWEYHEVTLLPDGKLGISRCWPWERLKRTAIAHLQLSLFPAELTTCGGSDSPREGLSGASQ
jgi:hypothetical protein